MKTFRDRIPYEEITKVNDYLLKTVNMVNKKHFQEGQFKHQICGSYRRQAPMKAEILMCYFIILLVAKSKMKTFS